MPSKRSFFPIEAYSAMETRQWRRVEGVWEPGRCPRSCVGIGKDGKLLNWAETNPAVRVGAYGISLGRGRVLVTESEYEGAPLGLYRMEGQNSKLEKINVPNEFSGFVQAGCCAEI
ncbi:hypothetical protein HRI_003307000 [Hibiscus trionum]|uniref:Uncharacterized protein n=1 Tax=Hibiscus trionum TaxID=183268 RepID=A0A9W7MAE2_HIBTR|nr:hypothetical protein HRI_003307000 [Hibiscus trionum]